MVPYAAVVRRSLDAAAACRPPFHLLYIARGRCGGVVGGNTARWDVLSENTSTTASVRITIDAWAGNVRQPTKSAQRKARSIMIRQAGIGCSDHVLRATVVAWPSPSTLVVSTIFGVA